MDTAAFQSQEIARLWTLLVKRLDEFVLLAEALDQRGLHWKPPAEATNSIAVLLVHTLGNIEENLLEVLLRQPVGRNRDAEFVEAGLTGPALQEKWQSLRQRLETALATAPASELDLVRSHPRRGTMTGREVLFSAAMHASEHFGQAELTRDLFLAELPAADF